MNQKSVRSTDSVYLIHITVLALYTLLAILLTWPLIRNISTHVAGDGIDDPALAWNLWWIKARLIEELNFDIFHADWMFFPVEINLGFYTLTPLNGLLSIPLQSVSSLIFTSNILLLASFILGGYGTYLLTLTLLTHSTSSPKNLFHIRCAATIAGIICAFASSKLFYASLGQFNIASSYWIPFCVLYLLRIELDKCTRGRAKNACFAGLFLVFQAWAELTYASFLLIFIAIYFVWLQMHKSTLQNRLALLGNFILAGTVFLIGLAPFLWAMIPDMLAEGDFFASGGGFADTYSADLFGYLVPTRLHPIWGEWVDTFSFDKNFAQHIYIGYVGLGLALLGAFARQRSGRTIFTRPSTLYPTQADNGDLIVEMVESRTSSSDQAADEQGHPGTQDDQLSGFTNWFWLINLIVFWLLTLGPILRWRGENLHLLGVPLYGPFALISQLPFFSGNRYPSRYSVMLMLCVALLAAMGVAWILNHLNTTAHTVSARNVLGDTIRRRSWLAAGICTLLALLYLGEHLSAPLPINKSVTPPIYETIRDTPGDFTVLELPTGWRNGAYVLGKSDKLIMMQQWYQSIHGKRRLGGNTSRNPSFKFEYFINAPLIKDLIPLMNADPTDTNQAHIVAAVADEYSEMIARNKTIAPQVLDFLDVRFVTLDVTRSPAALQEFVERTLPVTLIEEWRGEDWDGQPQHIRLYAVDGASVDSAAKQQRDGWMIRLGDEESSIYLAEGWSALADDGAGDSVRYAVRPRADLLLDIAPSGGQLSFELSAATGLDRLMLNGTQLTLTSEDGREDARRVVAQVPPNIASAPVDRLTLHFAQDPVPVALPLRIVSMSAGKEHGDYARLFVNGQNVALNEIGYNLAAVAPTGELLESVVFNTHNLQDEVRPSAAMAAWLGKWPAGTVIAGAVRDTASDQLGEDAVDALKQIGIVTDLRGKLRWNHAFITAIGNPLELPLEESSLLHPSAQFLGSPVTSEFTYGAVQAIAFEPAK